MSGQAGLGQVAAPVGEALIMTGLGIAVAIPAVVFYNLAVRINRRVMYHANDRAHDLLANSAQMVDSAQASITTKPAMTQTPIVKESHASAENIQQTSHYRNSASSQP